MAWFECVLWVQSVAVCSIPGALGGRLLMESNPQKLQEGAPAMRLELGTEVWKGQRVGWTCWPRDMHSVFSFFLFGRRDFNRVNRFPLSRTGPGNPLCRPLSRGAPCPPNGVEGAAVYTPPRYWTLMSMNGCVVQRVGFCHASEARGHTL